jgi:serine/threonine protein kinase
MTTTTVDDLEKMLQHARGARDRELAASIDRSLGDLTTTRGSRFGTRWRVKRHLNPTLFGHLHEVVDDEESASRTLLCFDHAQVGIPEALAAFRRGLETLVALQEIADDANSLVPRIEEMDSERRWVILRVCEHAPIGRELSRWNHKTKVSAIKRLLSGIGEMHSRGFMFRNLSTTSIVTTPAERLVLVDWALAVRVSTNDTFRAGSFANPAFMAPEQRRGSAPYDQRTDVYSLGRVLNAIVSEDPEPMHCPVSRLKGCRTWRRVRRTITAATQPDPTLRTPNVRTLLRELQARRHSLSWPRVAVSRATWRYCLRTALVATVCWLLRHFVIGSAAVHGDPPGVVQKKDVPSSALDRTRRG